MKLVLALFLALFSNPSFCKDQESLISKLISPGPLSNVHKNLDKMDCFECHTTNQGIPNDKCLNCHQEISKSLFLGKKSFHKTNKNKQCITCHDEHKGRNFDPAEFNRKLFDHSETGFILSENHSKPTCSQCHTKRRKDKYFRQSEPRFFNTSSKCKSCHQNDDTHLFTRKFKEADCSECHNESGWALNTQFSHIKDANYKRPKGHEKYKCQDCHANKNNMPKYRLIDKSISLCSNCHQTPHKEEFSKKLNKADCTTCHQEADWKDDSIARKNFNHDDTDFPLTDKHLNTSCKVCHIVLNKKVFQFKQKENNFCNQCHQSPHENQFQKIDNVEDCLQCHTTEKFKMPTSDKFSHQNIGFNLVGKHSETDCNKCHTPLTPSKSIKIQLSKKRSSHINLSQFYFKNIKEDECSKCHQDEHKGEMGTSCTTCHTERDWEIPKDFHKNLTLKGVHYSASCSECHVENYFLKGFGNDCQSCHQKDDIHQGSLPNCSKCHSENFWEVTRFKHSLSSFPLRGAHRTLDCFECHQNGIYQGTSTNCIDCHLTSALQASNPTHLLPQFEDCNRCHNQFIFK